MSPPDFHRKVIWCLWVIVFGIGMVMFALYSKAHDWYDIDCCSKSDCRPVNAGEVEAYDDGTCTGYRHIETGKLWCWGKSRMRPSQDGGDHICWPSWSKEPNGCFYYGMQG